MIGDSVRLPAHQSDGVNAFFDLYFAMTSRSGLWTFDEMAAWQRAAALRPRKAITHPMSKGTGLQAADKPAGSVE